MCDVRGGFGKALSKKGLGNIIVRMVLRAGRRVSREQLKQDTRPNDDGIRAPVEFVGRRRTFFPLPLFTLNQENQASPPFFILKVG
jgi:hypothetical protein